MSAWQALYAGLLLSAIIAGQPGWRIVVVMAVNFAGTAMLNGDPLTVGVLDVACAVALLGSGSVGHLVAVIFALMVPVYVAGWALGWSNGTTYAIIDALAYLQCAVIGGVGGGLVDRLRDFGRRGSGADPSAAAGRFHAGGSAVSSREAER